MRKQMFVSVLFFCFTLALFLWPLVALSTTHTTSVNDGILITWLTHQSADASIGKGDWYNWPFFYPYTQTATYSDPFLTSAALLLGIRFFTENVVLQYNLLLILAAVGNFWSMFVLAHKLWGKYLVSCVAATVFAFSYTQYQFIPHLHSYLLFGLPLGLWAIISYFETERKYFAAIWGVAFVLQGLNAPMTGYFFLTSSIVYVVFSKTYKKLRYDTYSWGVFLVACSILIYYYLPYVVTAQEFQIVRTIRDTAHFSYPIEKLLSLEILFAVTVFALSWSKVPDRKNDTEVLAPKVIAAIIMVGAVCMLGPVIKVGAETVKVFEQAIPLPYAVFYYLVPGLQAFRSVSRWAVVLNLGLALALGWSINQLLTRSKKALALTIVALYVGGTFILTMRQQYLYPTPLDIPEIYTWVRESKQNIVAEFPLYQWSMGALAGQENQRLRYQLYHKKTLYNGVSGITPPAREGEMLLHAQHFPEEESLRLLRSAGVELLVVHYAEFAELTQANYLNTFASQKTAATIKKQLASNQSITLLGCTAQPQSCLYQLE
jgi:hypothetical protein